MYTFPQLGNDKPVIVPENNLANLGIGLQRRVFMVKDGAGGYIMMPKPAYEGIIEERLKPFRDKFFEAPPVVRKHTFDEVINSFTGGKRTIYRNALKKLRSEGFSSNDAKIRAFVKCEKLTKISDPRLIQPRTPAYHLLLAQYLKLNEKKILAAVDRAWGWKTIFKGLNVEERGSYMRKTWNCFDDPVAVGLDNSRHDAHCSRPILEEEHKYYKPLFESEELNELLRLQLKNVGVGIADDGKIEYEVDGCRMSGDINTSLGNCIIVVALVWSYLRSKGIDGKLVNDGDDCVVFMERRDLPLFQDGLKEWFLEMGFEMCVEEPVFEFSKIEFCQSNPVWTPRGYVMVRKPSNAIAKDTTTTLGLLTRQHTEAWLGAVGMCNMAINNGIPVQYQLAKTMFNHGKKPKNSEFLTYVLSWGYKERLSGIQTNYRTPHSIHPSTRLSYWNAFGLLPAEQIALEQYYEGLKLDLNAEIARGVNSEGFPKILTIFESLHNA